MVKTRVIRLLGVVPQIAFCGLHSFLVEVQTDAGYIHGRMRDNNLKIRIVRALVARHSVSITIITWC